MTVGSESILFEDGPFSVFGVGALTREPGASAFTPDYTVKLLANVQILKVSRVMYRSALRATRLERQDKTPETYQEYDEIFFEESKHRQNNHLYNNKQLGASNSPVPTTPDAISAQSYDSDRAGTPTKHQNSSSSTKRRMDSLLRRLTPKYDRKKDLKEKEDVVTPLSVGSGQENPLMENQEDPPCSLPPSLPDNVVVGVGDDVEQNGNLDRTTTDSPV